MLFQATVSIFGEVGLIFEVYNIGMYCPCLVPAHTLTTSLTH